ncbi:MAG: hypothetical protein KDA41_09615, partial [Planctomycetales bacterium]|nr:hypothetical protein [Planctomycetales bacterium]
MKRLIAGLALSCAAAVAYAQEPSATVVRFDDVQQQTPSMATLTPEMWMYMQEMQRHDNPQVAVRRKAEERAQ